MNEVDQQRRRRDDPEEADYLAHRSSPPPPPNGSLTKWVVRTVLAIGVLLLTSLTAKQFVDVDRELAESRADRRAALAERQQNLLQIRVNQANVEVLKAEIGGRLTNIEVALARLEKGQDRLAAQLDEHMRKRP
jgi:hypothetical protein